MKIHRPKTSVELGIVMEIVKTTAERVRLTGDLLKELSNAWLENEKVQRRFRVAVLQRLTKIELTATMIQSAQIVQGQGTKPGYEERIAEEVKAVDEFISQKTDEMGRKMANYLYRGAESDARAGKQKAKSDWEI